MKPSAKAIMKAYDNFCKRTCSLEVGISRKFENNIQEQHNGKSLHANNVPTIFDDPVKQRKFQSILDDVIIKTLNDPSDQQIFRTALEGMERNYPNM